MCVCMFRWSWGHGAGREMGEPEMVGSFALLFKSGVPGMSVWGRSLVTKI